MIYKLNKPDIDTIIDYCDNLKANEKLEVYKFGQNKDLVLHIWKDEEFDPKKDKDYCNIVTISTFQDGICIDDTEDTYVTDGSLYRELERINNYKDLAYRQEKDLCREKLSAIYQTYKSLYLNFENDNIEEFDLMIKNSEPITKLQDTGTHLTEKDYYNAYLEASIDIAKIAMSDGYFTFEDLYKEYPLLKEVSDRLESEFYDKDNEPSPDI